MSHKETAPSVDSKTTEDTLTTTTERTLEAPVVKTISRTSFILSMLSYMWFVHIIIISGIIYVLAFHVPQFYDDVQLWNVSCYWKLGWLFPLPYTIICFFGLILPFRVKKYPSDETNQQKQQQPKQLEEENSKGRRRQLDNLYILTVSKGNNREAVMRSWEAHKGLENIHESVHVHVLTDEPNYFPDIHCFTCPEEFSTEHSKFKARALEWYRRKMNLGENDWILHLDEESVVDETTIRACLNFIFYDTDYTWGQGIILYNQHRYFTNWFFTIADAIRVSDDIARFHLQYSYLHRPIFGAHGSFLLTNGAVENAVTWDLGSLTEDYQFAVEAHNKGFKCGKVQGIVREQSPMNFMGFMKQRRRWYVGIRRLPGILPKVWNGFWTFGVFTLYFTIASMVLGFFFQYPTPRWLGVVKDFQFVTFIYLYVLGIFVQDLDRGVNIFLALGRIPLVIVFSVVATVMECLAVMYAVVAPPKGFDIIDK